MVSCIYILQLQHGCFYVGKSDNPYKRLTQHKNGRGSAWTRLHKPIRMVKKRKMTSTLQEDQITEEWMKKKGIDKVRGGMYCQIDLPEHISINDKVIPCKKRLSSVWFVQTFCETMHC